MSSFLQTDLEQAKDALNVRFWGCIACVKASHKYIRAGGSMTITSGTVAIRPLKDWAIASGGVTAARLPSSRLVPARKGLASHAELSSFRWQASRRVLQLKIIKQADSAL